MPDHETEQQPIKPRRQPGQPLPRAIIKRDGHRADMINRAFIEVMTAGDRRARVFTFPIPTYNITPDFPWESENATRLFAMTARYGLPYFQNFINSDMQPNHVQWSAGVPPARKTTKRARRPRSHVFPLNPFSRRAVCKPPVRPRPIPSI